MKKNLKKETLLKTIELDSHFIIIKTDYEVMNMSSCKVLNVLFQCNDKTYLFTETETKLYALSTFKWCSPYDQCEDTILATKNAKEMIKTLKSLYGGDDNGN